MATTEIKVEEQMEREAYAGVLRFYELAKKQEWQVRDLPWGEIPPIPEAKGTPQKIARRRDMWRSVITQQLQADELACEMSSQLLNIAPDPEAKLYYSTMVQDESRHTEAWLKLASAAGGTTARISLAGKAASVETGTTNKDYLDAQSKRLTSMGKKAIKVVTFPKDTDAANALRTGRVDAYFGDAPVVAYYIEQTPDAFALGGNPVNPIPIGIAIRKSNNDLRVAVTKGIRMIYADGTMDQILKRWKLAGAVAKLQ